MMFDVPQEVLFQLFWFGLCANAVGVIITNVVFYYCSGELNAREYRYLCWFLERQNELQDKRPTSLLLKELTVLFPCHHLIMCCVFCWKVATRPGVHGIHAGLISMERWALFSLAPTNK